MRKKLLIATVAAVLGFGGLALGPASRPALANEGPALAAQKWSWDGLFGTYDHASLRRGFQIYKEVCSGCHALKRVAYRNLKDIGLTEEQAKAIAAEYKVKDGPNDEGNMYDREARLSDHFASPYPNEQASRAANNGAYPPDLSLMTKARTNGPDYVYALMTGYEEAPADFKLNEGMQFNKAFPGHQIAMPPPLAEGSVTYADGTQPTLAQESKDVVSFLNWTAEPELDARKSMGLKVMIFLVVLTALLYAAKRRIWADVH